MSSSSGSEEDGPDAEHSGHDHSNHENPASTPPLMSLLKQQLSIIELGLRFHFLNVRHGRGL